jgi:S-adenosylmethionine:tRNA ribosyltransferase-isomerase
MSAAPSYTPQLADASAPPERRGMARDAVRMLVTDRGRGTHEHRRFCDLPSLLHPDDLLVVNDSLTLPAALSAQRYDGETLRLHVSTAIDRRVFMVEPRGLVLSGEELRLPDGGSVVMLAPVEPEMPRVWYGWFGLPLPMHAYLMQVGEPIRYAYIKERFPLRDYQTIFAREPGSSEMPSAARPFTARTLRELKARGAQIAAITLHCGVASFEAPERPAMERYAVSGETAASVNAAREEGRRVIAVGTTVVRALESALHNGKIIASSGWTDLVIDGTKPTTTIDGLLTGFHGETATHQWMLRAFLGGDVLAEAFAEAASCAYEQHEFGDVHLIV